MKFTSQNIYNLIDLARSYYRNFYISTKEKILNFGSAQNFSNLHNFEHPLFIVGVPNSLHIVTLCLKYIPKTINTIFISNGLSNWEYEWAKDHLDVKKVVDLNYCARHGTILDLLIDNLTIPFGILDYDCFVFNNSLFTQMQENPPELMCKAVFRRTNPHLNLDFPETFLMTLNPVVLKQIKKTYGVSSNQIRYPLLPNKVKKQLLKININNSHLPEEYKKVIDTLRLIISLGYSEGLTCGFIGNFSYDNSPDNQIFHVGGTSLPNYLKGYHQLRGSYFWRKALDECKDVDLREHYWSISGKQNAQDLLELYPWLINKAGVNFFELVDKIIS